MHDACTCLNCGHHVALRFCPHCGQEHKEAADMALRPLLSELAAEWVSWDSKMLRTLGALLFQPGRLSAEYNAGRRARYLSPLRLYLVVSALFFLVLSSHSAKFDPGIHNNGSSGKVTGTVNLGGQKLDMATLPATVAVFDTRQRIKPLPQPMRTIARQIVKARANGQTFVQSLNAQFLEDAPRAMFLLFPAFALLLKLTYRRQKRYYVEHLIFALHSHAFTFLVLAGLVLWPNKWSGDGTAQGVFTLLIAAYLLVALHRVYGQGWGKTFAKFCWLGFNYLFLLTFTLLLALGAAFLTA